MVKLLSLIVFIAAFVWTWFLFNSDRKISQATHAGIQSKLMLLIEETIKKSRPNSSEFEIISIQTQELDDNQVSARFSYKYSDQLDTPTTTTTTAEPQAASPSATPEKVNQSMSGEAILYRALSENPEADKWVIKSVKTENSSLEFLEGTTVNSEDLSPEPATNTTTETTHEVQTPSKPPPEKKTE